ncbi:indole-3-glycerol phosphate synthase TrpC [Helicovermis profundi]|uniref:indole-3-glycerol-phosphate synthase n=1 Tax=Helicovermis profundi TaxID=3065157 RepID=A0AAU9EDX5_9FIRM|nr:indole-3-glycerol phosphate synthase TrpC [Clostridia bacterium S502]
MNILNEIVNKKKQRLLKDKAEYSIEYYKKMIKPRNTSISFKDALKKEKISIIAEIKRASPSLGIIDKNFNHIKKAKEYHNSGVSAISVLTEEDFFLGKIEYISDIRKITNKPILRKDFITSKQEIYQSRVYGADAILLIASILTKEKLNEFIDLCKTLKMDSLVEVHTKEELLLVLETKADIIGINNRNLKTFETDINNTLNLKKYINSNILLVSESGVKTLEDIIKLEKNSVDGVLIGESFMNGSIDLDQYF